MSTTKNQVYCKSCFNTLSLPPYRRLIEKRPLLCNTCISQINIKLEIRKVNDIKVLFLSDYDGIMKTWLMNYKEYGDIELAPCFLYCFLPIIRLMFHDYVFVPCPSSEDRINKRGFDHLTEILKASRLPHQSLLCKRSALEQKNMKGQDRFKKKGIYLVDDKCDLSNRKIVLFDDVMTTGSTFLQSLEQLRKCNPQKIVGLIIMDNQKMEERKLKA